MALFSGVLINVEKFENNFLSDAMLEMSIICAFSSNSVLVRSSPGIKRQMVVSIVAGEEDVPVSISCSANLLCRFKLFKIISERKRVLLLKIV